MVDEHFPKHEQLKSQEWQYHQLQEALITACKQDQRGIVEFEQLPETIDTKTLGEKTLACVEASQQDQRTTGVVKEFGSIVIYDPGSESVKIKKDLIVGPPGTEVELGHNSAFSSKAVEKLRGTFSDAELDLYQETLTAYQVTKNRDAIPLHIDPKKFDTFVGKVITRWIGSMHSHPSETSFSFDDIIGIVGFPDMKISLVGTDQKLHALVKTSQTPRLARQDWDQQIARWNQQQNEYARSLIMNDRNLAMNIQRDPKVMEELMTHITQTMVKNIAKEYKLGYYENSGASPVVKRLT